MHSTALETAAAPAPGTPAPRVVPRSAKVFSYWSGHLPAATVEPGERFVVETASAFGEFDLAPGDTLTGLERSRCDPLTGPIAIAGARPGDVLEVHVEAIEVEGLGAQGVIPGGGVLEWPTLPLVFHRVDGDEVVFLDGLRLPLAPMIGCIGTAPLGPPVESVLPGDHGGNMDTRHVCPGSVVELPVLHEGGLLFLGDCHQLQGDGELCGVAPETDARVTLRCAVRRDEPIPRPRIRTATRLYLLASDASVEAAAARATGDLVDLLIATPPTCSSPSPPTWRSASSSTTCGPSASASTCHSSTRSRPAPGRPDPPARTLEAAPDGRPHDSTGAPPWLNPSATPVCAIARSASGNRSRSPSRRWGRCSARSPSRR